MGQVREPSRWGSLPKVAFPSPSQGTTADGQVGRGQGESEGLYANKRGREGEAGGGERLEEKEANVEKKRHL